MENIVCKSCGGSVTRQGNYYVCDFCRSKWMIDSGNDVHAVERANAWSALREGDFEKAAELFESIIVKDGNSHEGYWGRALALNGIIYVDDVREGKKVPTCNNITENPFLKDKDIQKAIALAPEEIKKSYQAQAEQIEKIRVEWLNVASKEPPYDVFISFKDSDRERGIERTQDSIDAQDIYTGLVDAGYKVFYSRVSLRGKVSEQYEPYIYNAIKTAKVMIVFGEKPEYFSSTWIKNEWSRFRTRIEKGEKHKNSLVVVVKNMNPSDLPVALKSRQAMNMSDLTFFETLKKHIKRVIDESNQAVHLDKIEIKGGQIAKKATTLEINAVQTREIGAGATAQTDITELQTLSLADTYMKAGQWEEAAKLVDDVLFNNPSCAEALWKQILIGKCVVDNTALSKKINEITETDLQYVDKILNCASQEMASEILDLFFNSSHNVSDALYCQILKTLLPYQYENRAVQVKNAFAWAIQNSKKQTFSLLLTTLGNKDIDKYIKYNLQYANTSKTNAEKKECIDRILKVDEGNMEALKMLLYIQLQDNEQSKTVIKTFESILKYSHDNRAEISELLTWLGKNLNSLDDCALVKQVLRYSTDDISTWKTELITLAQSMIKLGYFEEAEYLLKLVLTFDALNPTVYWDICLIKVRATSENGIKNSNIPLKQVPEYTKYLTIVDENRRLECLKIVKKQENALISKKKAKKVGIISGIIAASAALITGGIILFNSVIYPTIQFNKATELVNAGKYEEAAAIYEGLEGFGDSDNKLNIIDAVNVIEHGDYETGIRELLDNNATVVISYDCAGGNINGSTRTSTTTTSFSYGKNILTANADTGDDSTFTYTNAASFSGLERSTRNGYDFQKWTLVDCNPKLSKKDNKINLSFVASWDAKDYKITYDLQDGKVSGENVIGYNPDDATFTLINPTRTGYTFIGWTGTDLTDKTLTVTIPSGSYGNRKYTAHWQGNEYKISYNANNGTSSKTEDTAVYGNDFTLATAEREYYTFSGWYVGNTKYNDGEWKTAKDVTLTAKWTPIPYEITYNLDGGSTTNPATYTVEDTVNFSEPTKTGYTFLGWTGTGLTEQTKTVTVSKGTTGERTYTAHWQANTYKVVYDANGGASSKTEDTAVYDNDFTLATAEREYYTFAGWYVGNTKYNDGEWKTAKDVTLTAKWTPVPYEITYNLDGGSTTNPATYTVEDTVNFSEPTKTGYTFLGWTGTGLTEQTKTVTVSKGTTGERTYTAHWQANTYKVVYDANGGASSKTEDTAVYDNDFTLATAEREYYTFDGWYVGNTKYNDGEWKTAKDVTLTAKWTPISYEITYNLDGGSASNKTSYTVEDELFMLNNPTKENATFVGWTGTDLKEQTLKVTIPEGSYGDRVYTANWLEWTPTLYFSYNASEAGITIQSYEGNVKTVVIPAYINGTKVTSISVGAFEGSNMSTIILPETLTNIGKEAFYSCKNLKSIIIPDSVNSIGESAFYSCTSLTSAIISNSVDSIEKFMFNGCTSLISVTIGNSVKSIGVGAFKECTSLTSVTIPNSVKEIAGYAFTNCSALRRINIPVGVTSIGLETFRNCSSLTSIAIPDGVTWISESAFENCSGLTDIVIPDSIKRIDHYAFYNCSSLIHTYYKGTPGDWSAINYSYSTAVPPKETRYYYVEKEADVPNDGGNYWHYVNGVPTPWNL